MSVQSIRFLNFPPSQRRAEGTRLGLAKSLNGSGSKRRNKSRVPRRVVVAVIGKEKLDETRGAGSVGVDLRPGSSARGGGGGGGGGPGKISVRAVVTVRKKKKKSLVDRVEGFFESFRNGIGKGILIQVVSEDIDPSTNKGKRSMEIMVRGWLPQPSNQSHVDEYAVNFTVPVAFGRPGAVLITNFHDKEFYLEQIVLFGFCDAPIFFPGNTWIHSQDDNPESRIIFSNQAYLPSQTPDGLKELREWELTILRGNGKGERKMFERIYDYDTYNDLANPDKDPDLARPVMGGKRMPYPRRCRTGRPTSLRDPSTESRIKNPRDMYVPRDEAFEEVKQATFSAGTLKALLYTLIPALTTKISSSDRHFENFSDIDDLYREGTTFVKDDGNPFEKLLISRVLNKVEDLGEKLLKYETPLIIARDPFSWLTDGVFGRQVLAGMNAMSIERLRELPIKSKLDPAVYGPPESALTREIIQDQLSDISVEEAIEQGRLFILDYHDILLPFIEKINALEDRKIYASRTIFYRNKSEVLAPIAIELSLPPTPSSPKRKRVFTHGHDSTTDWLWRLAKAHVCSNDTGVHQLVNHWLRTHACVEPYIISAHRNLSGMHPIFMLLNPHMRYTLEINALARHGLINAGGVIEECFTPGKYAMEISAAAYDLTWRFDMEGVPADLLRRGMAVEDPSQPCGIKLVIEDYPYAADSLLIWSAIQEWVHNYVSHFYRDTSVKSDTELQLWWDEIRNKGHHDKRNEPWWPSLDSNDDLVSILTTIIWIASGHHAAVNFGQYPFGGYMPGRPSLMKKLIPEVGTSEYKDFLQNPERSFLRSLPTQLGAMKIMAIQNTLSMHSPDEEYLGEVAESHQNWINDPKVLANYRQFSARLKEIEDIIDKRNKNHNLKNRCGAGIPPYELLKPSSGPGVTGRGIPNSISI